MHTFQRLPQKLETLPFTQQPYSTADHTES